MAGVLERASSSCSSPRMFPRTRARHRPFAAADRALPMRCSTRPIIRQRGASFGFLFPAAARLRGVAGDFGIHSTSSPTSADLLARHRAVFPILEESETGHGARAPPHPIHGARSPPFVQTVARRRGGGAAPRALRARARRRVLMPDRGVESHAGPPAASSNLRGPWHRPSRALFDSERRLPFYSWPTTTTTTATVSTDRYATYGHCERFISLRESRRVRRWPAVWRPQVSTPTMADRACAGVSPDEYRYQPVWAPATFSPPNSPTRGGSALRHSDDGARL